MKYNICTLTFVLLTFASTFAADTETQRQQMIEKGVNYLRGTQAEDGSFSAHAGVGPTGIVLNGLLDVEVPVDDPMVAKALAFLEKATQEDGGIYTAGGMFGNYESCVAIQCFNIANKRIKAAKKLEKGPYDDLLAKCEKYIRGGQYTEERGTSPDDIFYGGTGYGKNTRPDLSNTHFFIEALKSTGAENDDPAIQKALVFVSRCQNLESEHNKLEFAAKNSDGGFIYHPIGDGASPAGESADGGLRSYGSMTYAGLKSLIYAGVGADDPRVKAAHDWVKKHYDTESNPGLGDAGLYYYYTIFSKSLDVMKIDTFETEKGEKHDWRADLVASLAKRQQTDGSWVNESRRWLENDPNLVTGYALISLADCKKAE